MHCIDELTELVERCGGCIELRHRRIDGMKIRGGERTPILAHYGIGCGYGERRERLDDPKTHRVHYVRQTAHDLAERAELAREDSVD